MAFALLIETNGTVSTRVPALAVAYGQTGRYFFNVPRVGGKGAMIAGQSPNAYGARMALKPHGPSANSLR